MLERGEKIELLVEKSELLDEHSVKFRRHARDLKRAMWWKNVKFIIVIVVILVVRACARAPLRMIAASHDKCRARSLCSTEFSLPRAVVSSFPSADVLPLRVLWRSPWTTRLAPSLSATSAPARESRAARGTVRLPSERGLQCSSTTDSCDQCD